jgi:hypothetical protein
VSSLDLFGAVWNACGVSCHFWRELAIVMAPGEKWVGKVVAEALTNWHLIGDTVA